jgi:hypothetical protein
LLLIGGCNINTRVRDQNSILRKRLENFLLLLFLK